LRCPCSTSVGTALTTLRTRRRSDERRYVDCMLMACLACKCSPRRDAGRTSAGGAALALALVAPLHASAHHGALGGAALALARVAPLHASAHHGALDQRPLHARAHHGALGSFPCTGSRLSHCEAAECWRGFMVRDGEKCQSVFRLRVERENSPSPPRKRTGNRNRAR
jgi:hypothetical protein